MNKIGGGQIAADGERFGVASKDSNNDGVVDNRDVLLVTNTEASLNQAWIDNKNQPLVIAVDTRAAMFRPAGQQGVGGFNVAGGGHVVTLVDQRVGADGKVEYLMHNSWGAQFNGWVSADAIASAMNPTKGPDRSGAVPGPGQAPRADGGGTPGTPGSGSGTTPNWEKQDYTKPASGATSGNQPYEQQRDRNSVLTPDEFRARQREQDLLNEEEDAVRKRAAAAAAAEATEATLLQNRKGKRPPG